MERSLGPVPNRNRFRQRVHFLRIQWRTLSLPQHPIPRFRIHIKRFTLVPGVVENLIKGDREVCGSRFVAAIEHPLR